MHFVMVNDMQVMDVGRATIIQHVHDAKTRRSPVVLVSANVSQSRTARQTIADAHVQASAA